MCTEQLLITINRQLAGDFASWLGETFKSRHVCFEAKPSCSSPLKKRFVVTMVFDECCAPATQDAIRVMAKPFVAGWEAAGRVS